MKNTISRRSLLASGVAASAVIGLGIAPISAMASTVADCAGDHKKWGYRLGALMVDPTLDQAEKDILLATAVCPHCHTKIEAQGLSYSEHMPA